METKIILLNDCDEHGVTLSYHGGWNGEDTRKVSVDAFELYECGDYISIDCIRDLLMKMEQLEERLKR